MLQDPPVLHVFLAESLIIKAMHERKLYLELLTPSALEIVVAALLSVAILVVSNTTSLTYQLGTPDNRYYFRKLLNEYVGTAFGHLSQAAALGRITNFLIWAGAGAVTYLIIWLAFGSYVGLRNDVVVGTVYMSGSGTGHARYWAELIGRGLTRLGSVLLILLLAAVAVQVWYPLSIVMFRVWINDFTVPVNWVIMAEAFFGWMVVLHLGAVLLRLSMLRTRIFA